MTHRFPQQLTSLLLSALVLVWGIVPPGVQHAHAGGSDAGHQHDASHQHNNSHETAHHGSHDHHTGHAHHEHASGLGVSLLTDYVAHVHWQFFGIEFSTPLPDGPTAGDTGQGDSGDSTVRLPVARMIGEIVPTTQTAASLDHIFPAPRCAPYADVVPNLKPNPRPPNLVASSPLCDSARLERSGVLLV